MQHVSHTPGESKQSTSKVPLVIVSILMGVFMWYVTGVYIRSVGGRRVPAFPDFSTTTTLVTQQVGHADRIARDNPYEPGHLGALARVYHASGYSTHAQAGYLLALELEPDNWRWHYLLILLEEERGNTESAMRQLETYVELRPDHALAWYRLGEAAFNLDRLDEADKAYDRAGKLAATQQHFNEQRPPFFPLAAYADFGRARVSFRREAYEEAEERLRSVIESVPRFGAAHRLSSLVYEQLGQAEESQRQLDLSLQCGPYTPPVDPMVDDLTELSRDPAFLLKEAGVAFNKGDVNWSQKILRRMVQLYPSDEGAVGELVLLLCRLHQFEEALPLLERFLALPPTHHAAPSKIGAELVNNGHVDRALACFRLAVKLQPTHAPNHVNLGMALAMQREFEEAEQSFREALRIDPHSFLARRNLATAMFDAGHLEEAIVEYGLALESKPSDNDARHRLGIAHERLGNTMDALEVFFATLEQDPDHRQTLDRLASLLVGEGRIDEALVAASHLVEVAGEFPQAHLSLARVAVSAGKIDLAREQCRIALELDPQFNAARMMLENLKR